MTWTEITRLVMVFALGASLGHWLSMRHVRNLQRDVDARMDKLHADVLSHLSARKHGSANEMQ